MRILSRGWLASLVCAAALSAPVNASHTQFDTARDTPQRLQELARLHDADPTRWTFASASEADARKSASLLGFRYQLPDGGYDHSLLITLLDRQGRVLATTTTMVGDAEFQAKLQAATATDVP